MKKKTGYKTVESRVIDVNDPVAVQKQFDAMKKKIQKLTDLKERLYEWWDETRTERNKHAQAAKYWESMYWKAKIEQAERQFAPTKTKAMKLLGDTELFIKGPMVPLLKHDNCWHFIGKEPHYRWRNYLHIFITEDHIN